MTLEEITINEPLRNTKPFIYVIGAKYSKERRWFINLFETLEEAKKNCPDGYAVNNYTSINQIGIMQ